MKVDLNIQYGCGCKKNQAEAQAAQVQSAKIQSVKTTTKAIVKSTAKR